MRAHLLKEDLQFFWGYRSPYWAGWFLDKRCTRTMRSKIEPMKRVARMLRNGREPLLNRFQANGQISSAVADGFNTDGKLTARSLFHFRTCHGAEIPLYHEFGALPEVELAHRVS